MMSAACMRFYMSYLCFAACSDRRWSCRRRVGCSRKQVRNHIYALFSSHFKIPKRSEREKKFGTATCVVC